MNVNFLAPAMSILLLLAACDVGPSYFGDYSGKSLLGTIGSASYLANYAMDSGSWVEIQASTGRQNIDTNTASILSLESLNQIPTGEFSGGHGLWYTSAGVWKAAPVYTSGNLVYERKESNTVSHPIASFPGYAAGNAYRTHVEFQIDDPLNSTPYFGFYYGSPTNININSPELAFKFSFAEGVRSELSATATASSNATDSLVLAGQEESTITVYSVRVLQSDNLDVYGVELPLTRWPSADQPELELLSGGTFRLVLQARFAATLLANQFNPEAITAELAAYEPGTTEIYNKSSAVLHTDGWAAGVWEECAFLLDNPLFQNALLDAEVADTVLAIRLYSFDINNLDSGVVEFSNPQLFWEP